MQAVWQQSQARAWWVIATIMTVTMAALTIVVVTAVTIAATTIARIIAVTTAITTAPAATASRFDSKGIESQPV